MFVMYPVVMNGMEPVVTASIDTIVDNHIMPEYEEIDSAKESYLGDINGQEYGAEASKEYLQNGGALYIKEDNVIQWVIESVELS